MITNNQIKAMTENELSYLYYCCHSEWESKKMPYEFNINMMKCFRNNTIQYILNKYSSNLTDENKGIIIDILNKLQNNV